MELSCLDALHHQFMSHNGDSISIQSTILVHLFVMLKPPLAKKGS